MDYDGMSQRELAAACAARGLPVYGSKAQMRERLAVADPGGVVPAAAVPQAPPAARRRFTVALPAASVEDREHTALRLAARQAAIDAGHEPRGGLYAARLMAWDGATATYEVPVR